jgi:RimJ/RimL family protein N-acetyltransferase
MKTIPRAEAEDLSRIVLQTERLLLRRLSSDDAEFILELLNQPSFLHYIGDKGLRTNDDAINYIQTGPVASYERFGFGLYLVELKDTAVPLGICGLLKRDALPDVDVGFAFLPYYWSRGYAFEAAAAVMNYGKEVLGLRRIVAITSLDNEASIRLLEKIGLKFERLIKLAEDQSEVRLFGTRW